MIACFIRVTEEKYIFSTRVAHLCLLRRIVYILIVYEHEGRVHVCPYMWTSLTKMYTAA